jgi:hypothetical protein
MTRVDVNPTVGTVFDMRCDSHTQVDQPGGSKCPVKSKGPPGNR